VCHQSDLRYISQYPPPHYYRLTIRRHFASQARLRVIAGMQVRSVLGSRCCSPKLSAFVMLARFLTLRRRGGRFDDLVHQINLSDRQVIPSPEESHKTPTSRQRSNDCRGSSLSVTYHLSRPKHVLKGIDLKVCNLKFCLSTQFLFKPLTGLSAPSFSRMI
jgi:hypothetical protein